MKSSVREVVKHSDIIVVSKQAFKKELAHVKHDAFVIDL